MPTSESKGAADFRAEFWGGSLDGIARTLGFPMGRRTSLMYERCVVSTLPSKLLARFLRVVPFRQPARSRTTCPSCAASRPCCKLIYVHRLAWSSSLPTQVLLVPGVWLQHAELWRTLCNLAEEQGEHVRLSWGASPASARTHAVTVCSAALVTPARSVLCGYQFRAPDQSHQRAGGHSPDVARQTSGKLGGAQAKNLVLRRQPRRAWRSLSVRPCRSTCCGCHLGPTRAAPRPPVGFEEFYAVRDGRKSRFLRRQPSQDARGDMSILSRSLGGTP